MIDVSTAILAGGAATRLGGIDKGLALLQGRPLIEWVIDALPAECRQRLLIVANRNVEQYLAWAPTISDAQSGFAGPLAGIAAALAYCTTPWLLTLPVDCPRPPAGFAERLLHEAGGGNHLPVVARDNCRRQPLFALYPRELATSAKQALDIGLGVTRWQESIGARVIDLSDLCGEWTNLNTAEDFAGFEGQSRVQA